MLVYLLYATKVLHCRECDDNYQYYDPDDIHQYYDPDDIYSAAPCKKNSNKTTRCHRSESFCAMYKFDCGKISCYARNCDYLRLCKSAGTHEAFYSEWQEKITVNCCQGDLCNDKEVEELFISIGTSVGWNKISNHMCLYYFIVSQLFT